jgi:hypothetical protein
LTKILDCGPGGGEGGQIVVAAVLGCVIVRHCANGDHIGHVARHADRHWFGPGVACGRDDNDAGLPSSHGGLVEGVLPVVRLGCGAEGAVENADTVGVLVFHGPIDGANDVQIGPTTPCGFSARRRAPAWLLKRLPSSLIHILPMPLFRQFCRPFCFVLTIPWQGTQSHQPLCSPFLSPSFLFNTPASNTHQSPCGTGGDQPLAFIPPDYQHKHICHKTAT